MHDRYRMASRHAGLDFEHTSLCLKHLARFHAVSFAMFQGDYDKILEKYPYLEEKMFLPADKVAEPQKLFFKGCIDNVLRLLDTDDLKEAHTILSNAYGDPFWTIMNKLTAHKNRNSVINHGDCWTNNMMFKYDDSNKPVGLKFIDFQLSRCCSRAIDLNYFFFSSPQYDSVLTEREEEILRVYYDEFSSFAKKLGVDSEQSDLTWEAFKEEFDECRYYGLFMGLMLAPIIAAQSEQVPDMEKLTEEDMTGAAGEEFFNQLVSEKANRKMIWMAKHHLAKCTQFSAK
jgi:hypothetical protein